MSIITNKTAFPSSNFSKLIFCNEINTEKVIVTVRNTVTKAIINFNTFLVVTYN